MFFGLLESSLNTPDPPSVNVEAWLVPLILLLLVSIRRAVTDLFSEKDAWNPRSHAG
jgi:hypothetical protein